MRRARNRGRHALRRLAGLFGVAASVAAVRRRVLAVNERRYGDELGLDPSADSTPATDRSGR